MAEMYCVMNVQKRHRSDVSGIQKENNREYEDPSKYRNNVDLSRSKDNVYFIKSDDWHASIAEACEQAGVTENKNSVVLITSVYTASPEWFKEHTKEEAMEYFMDCLEYEKAKGVCINAVLHMDEDTPHLQTATVPIVDVPSKKAIPVWKLDENGNEVLDAEGNKVQAVYEKGKSKGQKKWKRVPIVDENGNPVMHKGLNAAHLVGNKVKMSHEQTVFYERCGKPHGMARGEIRIIDGKEAVKRKSEADFAAQKIVEDAQKKAQAIIDDANERAQTKLERTDEEIDDMLNEAEGEVRELQESIDSVDEKTKAKVETLAALSTQEKRLQVDIAGLQMQEEQLEKRKAQLEQDTRTAQSEHDDIVKKTRAVKSAWEGDGEQVGWKDLIEVKQKEHDRLVEDNKALELRKQELESEVETKQAEATLDIEDYKCKQMQNIDAEKSAAIDNAVSDAREDLRKRQEELSEQIAGYQRARKAYEDAKPKVTVSNIDLEEAIPAIFDEMDKLLGPKKDKNQITGETSTKYRNEEHADVHKGWRRVLQWIRNITYVNKSTFVQKLADKVRDRFAPKDDVPMTVKEWEASHGHTGKGAPTPAVHVASPNHHPDLPSM